MGKRVARENKSEEEFKLLMKMNNPAVIPRNHKVEEALEAAEKMEIIARLRG